MKAKFLAESPDIWLRQKKCHVIFKIFFTSLKDFDLINSFVKFRLNQKSSSFQKTYEGGTITPTPSSITRSK